MGEGELQADGVCEYRLYGNAGHRGGGEEVGDLGTQVGSMTRIKKDGHHSFLGLSCDPPGDPKWRCGCGFEGRLHFCKRCRVAPSGPYTYLSICIPSPMIVDGVTPYRPPSSSFSPASRKMVNESVWS